MKSLTEIRGLVDLGQYSVFSQQHFDEVTLGDADLQRQLIASFLKQLAEVRQNLIRAGRAGQEPLRQVIHQLKGICHFTAAQRVLQVIASIKADQLDDEGARMQIVEVILEALEELKKALAEVLTKLDRDKTSSPAQTRERQSGPAPEEDHS